MKMVRLVYISTLTDECTAEERKNILEKARDFNSRNGLTGILCWKEDYFLQWFEGESSKVNELYRSLVNDKRHTDVRMIDYSEVAGRSFPDWKMAYIADDDLTEDVLFKYSPAWKFNPYNMSGESICGLLEEVAIAKKEILDRVEKDISE